MAHLTLHLLGTFQARLNTEAINSFGSTKAQALLSYLALEADRPHSRAFLAALLWPEDEARFANKNLRQALYTLRQVLQDAEQEPPFLLTNRQTIQFNLNSHSTVDVTEFVSHLKQQQLSQALDYYAGDLLTGFESDSSAFETWLSTRREHLHQLALDGLRQLSEQALANGNFNDAILAARRLLAMEPWQETAHFQLMQALLAGGDRAGALDQFVRCQEILQTELGITPSEATLALYRQIRHDSSQPEFEPAPQHLDPVAASQVANWWTGVPEISNFFGRAAEQDHLRRWLVAENCRLVGVLGLGGLGKTTLVARLVRTQLSDTFDEILWYSLLNAPPLAEILNAVVDTLTGKGIDARSRNLDRHLGLLLEQMRRRRLLLVLDNLESILAHPEEGHPAGAFRPGYEAYGQLLRTIAQQQHRSCLLFTSRERPQGMDQLIADYAAVQSLILSGIDEAAGRALLDERGLTVTGDAGAELIDRYSGNPLALKLVAEVVRTYFGGDLAAFLAEEGLIFDDVRRLLDDQFSRLKPLEREVMIWLAIQRAPMTIQALQAKRMGNKALRFLVEAVRGLERRSLVEQSDGTFFLQNVITEYVTDYIGDTIEAEIVEARPDLLSRHGLLDTDAPTYVTQSQIRLLHQPILTDLISRQGEAQVGQTLLNLVEHLRSRPISTQGYGPGNLLNLLVLLRADLRAQNFSGLSIWHADLTEAFLPQANFSGSELAHSTFIHTFNDAISLAYSPDGSLLAAGSFNGTIHVWYTDSWQPAATLTGHRNWVTDLEFSPNGKRLASVSRDHSIRLWDVETMTLQAVIQIPEAMDTDWYSLSFHPDGQLLATGSATGVVQVWRVVDGELILTLSAPPSRRAVDAVWHPSGEQLLFSAEDGAGIAVWDLSTQRQVGMLAADRPVDGYFAISPDGALVAGQGSDYSLLIWDFATHRLRHRLTGHTDTIVRICYGWDGKWMASSSDDQTVRVWDMVEGKLQHTLNIHEHKIVGLATHPSRNEIASAANDSTLAIWDADTGRLRHLFRGYAGAVTGVAFSPDGAQVVSGSFSGQMNVWEVESGRSRLNVVRAHERGIYAVAYSPDGKIVATSNAGGESMVQLWDAESGRLVRTLRGAEQYIPNITFSPDGSRLVGSAGGGSAIHLWEVASGRLLKSLLGHTLQPYGVAYSPDGKWLASTGADRTVRLWDALNGEPVLVIQAHDGGVRGVAFHPTLPLLASSADTVCLWTVPGGELVAVLKGHEAEVRSLAFLPDGRLISASYDHTLRLWDVTSGMVLRIFQGHTGMIMSVAVSSDGRRAVSGGFDETVRIWDLRSGECLQIMRGERPYEGMNIAGAKGLNPAQIASLKELGAVERF